MSRARRRCEELGRIHVLRGLTMRLAEQGAQEVRRALHAAESEREEEGARLGKALSDWGRALAAPGFDPQAVVAWGGAVNRQVERIEHCDAMLETRCAELVQAQETYNRAVAEENCADGLRRKARARTARQREEKLLAVRDDDSTRQAFAR